VANLKPTIESLIDSSFVANCSSAVILLCFKNLNQFIYCIKDCSKFLVQSIGIVRHNL
jgi:hypothetical protein